ncbi:unnamed protein product [Blepharisma stoltei]|uniref:PHR domain-containing protein n=1 Tax=Blepharisma stoltei TaxID=1481888 RepID=A0AAU9KFN6_9CILI|nr:unnamed protein product [Blepharisma stoltei]
MINNRIMSKYSNNFIASNSQGRAEKSLKQERDNLTCLFCKSQPGKYFDVSTFMAYCITCSSQLNTSGFIDLESKALNNIIYEAILPLFNSQKKSLCPERRKWIMHTLSKTNKEMLDVYHWLNTYASSTLKCVNHPWIDAETIDLGKMALFCTFCSKDYPDLLPISENFKIEVQKAAIQVIGTSDIGILNKFILRFMKTREIENLNSLIIEVRDIIYNTSEIKISADSRCQNCLKKLGFGNRTPIRLPCENVMHVICYECLKESSFQCCSLDSQIYKSGFIFEHFPQKYDFPLCCKGSCFFNTQDKKPYKLPCYHYICLECKNSAENPYDFQCHKCYFRTDLNNAKLDWKLINNLTFIEVNCEDHNEQAVTFSSYGVKFFCENCARKVNRLPCKATRSLKVIEDVLECAFSCIYEKLPVFTNTYLVALKNKMNDFKVLSFQEKIKTLALMSLSSNNFSLIFDIKDSIESLRLGKTRSSYYLIKKTFERFKEIYPLYWPSLKSWVVEENQANAITLKSSKYAILYGLLIGGRSDSSETYIKQISITKSKKTTTGLIFLFEFLEKIRNKVNEVSFPNEILMEPNVDYTISVVLTPGKYFNGKPASLDYLVDEKNRILFEVGEPTYEMPFRYGGNNRIGGPILGFIYATFE